MTRRIRQTYDGNGNWWEHRTTLEKLLICGGVICTIIILLLLILLIVNVNKDPPPKVYNSCLGEALPIIQRLDRNADPCGDFYEFACGNLLKNARGNDRLGPFQATQDRAKRQIKELYGQNINADDHKIVRIAKRFYTACLNETETENGGLNVVKGVLRATGGWPVLEGHHWDKSKFDWMDTSRKLRKLGYFYSSFLDIRVEVDPLNENKYIFKVTPSNIKMFNKQEFMYEIAVLFGAHKDNAFVEMVETYNFMLELHKLSYELRREEEYQRITVTEFQKHFQHVDWLEFINNIVGPAVRIFRDDFVLFSSTQNLHKWFNFISKQSKRVQANYVLWKVIEEKLPYVSTLKKYSDTKERIQGSTFCIKQIRERFKPSPIDVMYVRRYLSLKRKQTAEELIGDLRFELLNLLESSQWMNVVEKQSVIQKVKEMKVIVGAPVNYFDDEIFADLDIDLDESNNHNFLSLLSRIDRNYESWKYNGIYTTKADSKISSWRLQTNSVIGDYFYQENTISIPATILQGDLFDENRPKYINYGSMGSLMGHHFLQVFGDSANIFDKDGTVINGWSVEVKKYFSNKTECFTQQLSHFDDDNQIDNIYMTDLILLQSLGLKLSFAAYKRWLENHKEEDLVIVDNKYTVNQLFWMSTATYFCQPSNPLSYKGYEEQEMLTFLISGSILNIQEFSYDFNCPLGSKMNPVNKCEIF